MATSSTFATYRTRSSAPAFCLKPGNDLPPEHIQAKKSFNEVLSCSHQAACGVKNPIRERKLGQAAQRYLTYSNLFTWNEMLTVSQTADIFIVCLPECTSVPNKVNSFIFPRDIAPCLLRPRPCLGRFVNPNCVGMGSTFFLRHNHLKIWGAPCQMQQGLYVFVVSRAS